MEKTIFMCPPDYFQIEYEINPWMNTENKVDPRKARDEFDALVGLYKELGADVKLIEPQEGLPDMVFAANHGFLIDDLFIRSNFRHPQRRREADLAEEYFKRQGLSVERLPEDVYFEGQGDMFYAENRFFCGYEVRTSEEAIGHLEDILQTSVVALRVLDAHYYHLDTCFAPIGEGTVIAKESSFESGDFESLKEYFRTFVAVPDAGVPLFSANCVAIGQKVVMGRGADEGVVRELEADGFGVHETPMDEFLKSGGSAKCLSLEWFAR